MVKRICPKCKSNDVRRIRGGLIEVLGFSENFVCNECGFSSPIFPDVETTENENELKNIEDEKILNPLNFAIIILLVLFLLILIAFFII